MHQKQGQEGSRFYRREDMTDQENLARALEELEKLTGIHFQAENTDKGNLKDAAEKAAQLVSAYKEKYNRTGFIRSVLAGTVPEAELYGRAASFHIPPNERRSLYIIEADTTDDETEEILRQLLLAGAHDLLLPVDRSTFVFIKAMKEKEAEADMDTLAHTIVDMAGAEAMKKVRVGYGNPCTDLADLPRTYREASAALEVGRIFYSGSAVFSYGLLGIGRLINAIPVSQCRLFLQEVFGDRPPEGFDQETVTTINIFFENNLNISETARQLFVHRNTLVYRLEKLNEETGLDIRKFDDALTFKIAVMVIDYLKAKENA